MRRSLPILRGLAILAVIFNHANWQVLSQMTITGERWHYIFVLFDQIGKFAIPAFLFITGYFIAYVTGGGKRDLPFKIIFTRLKNLFWPWLIWSLLFTIGQILLGQSLSLEQFLRTLFIQYYFVPMLSFYYLLAPWIVKGIRHKKSTILIGAAIIQLLGIALFYLRIYNHNFPPTADPWIDLGPVQYLRFGFYFPFGIVCGMFPSWIKNALQRHKTLLAWTTLGLFVTSIIEATLAYNMGGNIWPIGGDQTKLTSALFSTAVILYFATHTQFPKRFTRSIQNLGAQSYGLYLCHYPILGIVARLFERVTPWFGTQSWLVVILIFVLTVVLSSVFITSVGKLPTKKIYRYLFG